MKCNFRALESELQIDKNRPTLRPSDGVKGRFINREQLNSSLYACLTTRARRGRS